MVVQGQEYTSIKKVSSQVAVTKKNLIEGEVCPSLRGRGQ